ncbi:MAG: lamin tail domain-containing protein, partial [Planctomycetes bacterium]|nr:lamin tail domain-containing protein [Planctomycetota bacterium]
PAAGDYATAFRLWWAVSDGATSYRVFAGTDYTTVLNATTPLASPTAASYTDAAGTFSAGSTYYWRVDAVNASGATKGDVWSFTASNPVRLLLNECNPYNSFAYPVYVELYNATAVVQNLSGWTLAVYGGSVLSGTYTFPAGAVLDPGALLTVVTTNASVAWWSPNTAYKAHVAMFAFGWVDGTTQVEAILRDASGTGVDYVGANVVTSHLPAELSWGGAISGTGTLFGFYRNKTADTDGAGDWTVQNYWQLTHGSKNPGQ